MPDNAHTLVRLAIDSRVSLCKSVTRSGPQLNFGEVLSIPLTMNQAEDVANQLRAWIDEQLGLEPATNVVAITRPTNPDQPPPPKAA